MASITAFGEDAFSKLGPDHRLARDVGHFLLYRLLEEQPTERALLLDVAQEEQSWWMMDRIWIEELELALEDIRIELHDMEYADRRDYLEGAELRPSEAPRRSRPSRPCIRNSRRCGRPPYAQQLGEFVQRLRSRQRHLSTHFRHSVATHNLRRPPTKRGPASGLWYGSPRRYARCSRTTAAARVEASKDIVP